MVELFTGILLAFLNVFVVFFFFLTGVLRTLVSQDFKFVILLCMAKGWEWPRARFGSWSSKVGFQEALWPFS